MKRNGNDTVFLILQECWDSKHEKRNVVLRYLQDGMLRTNLLNASYHTLFWSHYVVGKFQRENMAEIRSRFHEREHVDFIDALNHINEIVEPYLILKKLTE